MYPKPAGAFCETIIFWHLRPLGIGTSLRRLIECHITKVFAGLFGSNSTPFQYAIGIKGGIDFLIQTYFTILPSLPTIFTNIGMTIVPS
jgi:hypothetical protein